MVRTVYVIVLGNNKNVPGLLRLLEAKVTGE